MSALLKWLFLDAETLRSAGNNILIAGLVGDIVVLFIPSRRAVLEKSLAALFVIVIIVGVWMERVGDSWSTEWQPNLITEEKAKTMEDTLRPFAGTPFDFSVNPASAPQALAAKIGSILEDAGWKWVAYPGNETTLEITKGKPPARVVDKFPLTGAEIDNSKTAEWGNAAPKLVGALAIAIPGLQTMAHATDTPNNAIHIYIGKKQ